MLLALPSPRDTTRCLRPGGSDVQPAEEDGSGAKLVVGDPRYDRIRPDYAFAIHNEPGLPFGYVGTRAGLINCASRGFVVHLAGRTSHAAEPELADSPITLIGPVISALQGLGVNLKLGKSGIQP